MFSAVWTRSTAGAGKVWADGEDRAHIESPRQAAPGAQELLRQTVFVRNAP